MCVCLFVVNASRISIIIYIHTYKKILSELLLLYPLQRSQQKAAPVIKVVGKIARAKNVVLSSNTFLASLYDLIIFLLAATPIKNLADRQ